MFGLDIPWIYIGLDIPVTLYSGNCKQLLKVNANLSSQTDPIEFYRIEPLKIWTPPYLLIWMSQLTICI